MSGSIDLRIEEFEQAVRMMALVGASLKLRSGKVADPAISEQIVLGARLALGLDPTTLEDPKASALLTSIGMALAEAGELFHNPDRGPGWQVEDVDLLQAQGRASRSVFHRILSLAETRPPLQDALKGRFLDVGTGVAGIAIEAANTCPGLQIDGIDIWEPALAIAERNVAESPHADRIRIAKLDVSQLAVEDCYSLIWLPTMFLRRAVLERALDRIVMASRSRSYLVAALYTEPKDPFMAVLSRLRTLRSGGEVTDPSQLEGMLRVRGYVDLEATVTPIATFIIGRLP
jgi:SAM-dependent methyltransferase